jgi:hypothetical protein
MPSYTGTVSGLKVTETIHHASEKNPDYPLLEGDILIKQEDGTYFKFGPGLGIGGFVLTPEQEATLEPVENQPFAMGGLDEFIGGGAQ